MCWNARTKPRLAAAPPQGGVALMRHSRSVSVRSGARASDEPPRGRLGDRVDDGDLHADLLLAWLDGHGRRRRAVSGALREDRVGNRALVRDADHGTELTAERSGELARLRLSVPDRGGAGVGEQRAGVGQVQRDPVDRGGVAGRRDGCLDLAAGPGQVTERGGELLADSVAGWNLAAAAVVRLDRQA